MRILALEASTSAAKALLYDTDAGVVTQTSEAYKRAEAHGGTQDADAVFAACLRVGRDVCRDRHIDAVVLCGTWHSIGVFDQAYRPVTPIFTWEYMDTAAQCAAMRADPDLTNTLYTRTGCMPHATYARHALLHCKAQGMDLSDKRFLSQGAYNFYRMTGKPWESVSTASGGGLIHLATLTYDPFVMELLGTKPEQFGRLVSFRDTAPLSAAIAETLGVAPGIPVVPAHPDGALNQLGSGCERAGRMTFSVGTSGAIRLSADAPVLSANRATWCYRGADGYISGAAVAGACNCINWFKSVLMGDRLDYEALEGHVDMPENPPVFLPFLFGERCPGWRDDRLAGFVDIAPGHDEKTLYYAVQMHILFCMLQCYQALTQTVAQPNIILASGGILASNRWSQMIADIFERPIRLCETGNQSLLGASVLGMHAVGAIADIRDFTHELDAATEISPNVSRYPYYRAQYARYLAAYSRN